MFRGGRLVLRIYLIGLAQVAVLAVVLAIVHDIDRPERRRAAPDLKLAQYVVEDVIAETRDPAVLQSRLQSLEDKTGLAVTPFRLSVTPAMPSVTRFELLVLGTPSSV